MKPRILLLSAYTATSHRLWCERLQAMFAEYDWIVLCLPPRNFNWTIRGNSLLWGFSESDLLQQPFDLIIATSMVDLSSLRGFIPALSSIPTILYFHENQFVYPAGDQRTENVEPQLVPLYAALCADRIVFNSHFNRDSFLQGARSLFKRLPDTIPASVLEHLQNSCVIPVPIYNGNAQHETLDTNREILEIVWNHRWEYDKGIDLLLELCRLICTQNLSIRLHIVGEQFRHQPAEFKEIDSLLAQHGKCLEDGRGRFGFVTLQEHYRALLRRSDVVLSTAHHDFQGLAVQEACVEGCTPVAPNNLVYPEYLEEQFLYPLLASTRATAEEICARLCQWQVAKAAGYALPKQQLNGYLVENVRPRYAALFAELLTAV